MFHDTAEIAALESATDRRSLLCALGAATVGGLAGCAGGGSTSDAPTVDRVGEATNLAASDGDTKDSFG